MAVANLIVGQQIKFVDGHACSGSSIPASDIYAENNVLMMSPASSNPVLTEKGHPTIMRLYGRDDAQGAFIAPWIAEKYKGKKIAILHDKSAYGKGVATVVKDKLNAAGVNEVMFEGINPGEKDYSAIVTKLKSAGADFVYFGGYHPEAGLIIRQAADQGYKPQLMTPDSLATSEFWQISGPAGEGVLFTFPTDPRRSPAAAHALEQFKAQGFNPEGFTLFSYGVVHAIADGIKMAGSDDPKAVAKALESGQPVETVMGPVKFDAKGDIKDPRYDINVWKEGKYAPIAQLGSRKPCQRRGSLGPRRFPGRSRGAPTDHGRTTTISRLPAAAAASIASASAGSGKTLGRMRAEVEEARRGRDRRGAGRRSPDT